MACLTLKRSLDLDPLHSPGRPTKRRRCTPVSSPTIPPTREDKISPFTLAGPRLSPDQIQSTIREEMRRFHRRKQLNFADHVHASSSPPSSSGPSSPNSSLNEFVENPSGFSVTSHQPSKEKALFTFKQVGLICERMLRDQEIQIREEYEQALTAKLAEQYDTFVKFTHDQIQKRFEGSAAPSYLS